VTKVGNYEECKVQAYVRGRGTKYFRVNSVDPHRNMDWVKQMVEISEASRWEKHKAGRLIKTNEGRGEHGPWLNMVGWKAIFNGQDMATLVPCIDGPGDDPVLKEIGPSVWRVTLAHSNHVAGLRATGSGAILYWLESTEVHKYLQRAFTVPKYKTIKRYAEKWRNLILFCWRSFDTEDINTRFDVTNEQRQALRALKSHLNSPPDSPPPSKDLTDRLVVKLSLSLIHQEGDLLPTIIQYFCGLVGWDRVNRCWKMPSQYTGFLAAMQYIIRVLETGDALQHGNGTLLARFRQRRDRWLVGGLTTPFSLVHQQLQYGLCCALDAPGSDPIRLPNANQVIYRGRMFEISTLKTLIKDVIREAEAKLGKLIFSTTTEVPDINPYQFSDDNTEREVGHYFALQHPRFIKDAKTAMFTNLSKNKPEIVSRMRGKLFASIDATEYAKQVDSFLMHLALLFTWTAGRSGRGRETLSVVFYNKPSASRNIVLYDGQFMVATGYHKGQSITDREKVRSKGNLC
jgi:hypothetical protein